MVTRDREDPLEYVFSRGRYANRERKNEPAAILPDLKQPFISGLEVLQAIRKEQRTRSIPVIMLSSSINETDLRESYALGATRYFRKPVDFNQFMEIIQLVKSSYLEGEKNSSLPKSVE